MNQLTRTILLTVLIVAPAGAWRYWHDRIPNRPAGTVDVAWWWWRNHAPAPQTWKTAHATFQSRLLFLHAGQFDLSQSVVHRVRPVTGALPHVPELHLVYNATPALLQSFERIDPSQLANDVIDTFTADVERARADKADVVGLQLDFDIPERLLPRYAELLKLIRQRLATGTQVSVTGLTTWLGRSELTALLDHCDFWIPQFYGAAIPRFPEEERPIASTAEVIRDVVRASRLDYRFYAGLSTYGHTVLFSANNKPLELRGDVDPTVLRSHPDLENVSRRLVGADARQPASGVWHEILRVRRDAVIQGMVLHPDDRILLEQPTSAALRSFANAVRENAGRSLLGLCLFRLPENDDKTSLSMQEIDAALSNRDTTATGTVAISCESHPMLQIVNTGTAAGRAMVTLRIKPGSFDDFDPTPGRQRVETLCRMNVLTEQSNNDRLVPCSPLHAEYLRIAAPAWRPGSRWKIDTGLKRSTDIDGDAILTIETDDGRQITIPQSLDDLRR